MKHIFSATVIAAALAIAGSCLLAKDKGPRPLSSDQRAAVLSLAVSTSNARISVLQLQHQLRSAVDAMNAAQAAEEAEIKKLMDACGAKGYTLNEKAEWLIEPPKTEPPKK